MISTIEIAERVGRRNIARAVGVGGTAVSNAVVQGSFPSSWYAAILHLCEPLGIECPPGLFRMKGSYSTQNVDSDGKCQESGGKIPRAVVNGAAE